MSARPWRVQYSITKWSDFWEWVGSYADKDRALEVAATGQKSFGDKRKHRLINRDTAEIIHLGRDGKPLPAIEDAEPKVHRFDGHWATGADGSPLFVIDRRTEAEVQADVLGDRYETSLERGRDL